MAEQGRLSVGSLPGLVVSVPPWGPPSSSEEIRMPPGNHPVVALVNSITEQYRTTTNHCQVKNHHNSNYFKIYGCRISVW